MEGEREGQQLLEPLIDIEGYAVPFGEHERMMDLQLPPLPVSMPQSSAQLLISQRDTSPLGIRS